MDQPDIPHDTPAKMVSNHQWLVTKNRRYQLGNILSKKLNTFTNYCQVMAPWEIKEREKGRTHLRILRILLANWTLKICNERKGLLIRNQKLWWTWTERKKIQDWGLTNRAWYSQLAVAGNLIVELGKWKLRCVICKRKRKCCSYCHLYIMYMYSQYSPKCRIWPQQLQFKHQFVKNVSFIYN